MSPGSSFWSRCRRRDLPKLVPVTVLKGIWRQLWQLGLTALIGATAGLAVWAEVVETDPSTSPVWFLLDAAAGLVAMVLVALRRHVPVAFTLLICAAAGFSVFSCGAWLLAVASLSTRRSPRLVGLMLGTTASAMLLDAVIRSVLGRPHGALGDDPETLPTLLAVPVVFALPVLGGWLVGSRRALVQSLRNEARSAEAARRVTAERARADERLRISREIHDEIGHRLSLIALHAGALEYRADLSSERIRHGAGVIRSSAHQAMGEVRRTLQVLRGGATEDASQSQEPGIDLARQIRHLAQDATDAGSPTQVHTDVPLASLPPSPSRHLHRIVQESLTNALRHAPGAPVDIVVAGSPGQRLELTVTNPHGGAPSTLGPADAGGGLGLVGARERAELAGGELTTEAASGLFIVRAWVPWPS